MKILKYILTVVALTLCCRFANAQDERQYIRNGNKFYRQQNYAKAETEYRKALGKNGGNTQAMYNLGCALMVQQKDSAAIVQFENAGKRETAHRRKSMAYHNIGVICQKHRMYGEAVEAYKESLRNNPEDHETRYNLALCQHLLKKQPKNNENKDKQNDKDKDKKRKDGQDKKQDSGKNEPRQQQQQPRDQMSRENVEQLLNYAVQEEKATQQRMRQQQQQPGRRRLEKNW